jgi:hypothetical protein
VFEGGRKDASEMKKILFATVCMMFTASVFAQVQFQTGNKLKQKCDGGVGDELFCVGYVTGIADAHAMSICTPKEVTQGQNMNIVKKYLNDNPAQLHRDADVLVLTALQQAFPCPKKK